LRETAVRGLRVVTAGPLPPDPATFIREHTTRERLAELYACTDIVIVDAPAISDGPDAFLLGLDTDATLLVVDGRQALSPETVAAASALEAFGIRTMGTLLHGTAGRARAAKEIVMQQHAETQSTVPGQLQLTPSRGEPWS
jgi:Mrp family chromosome partitioning ATPase